jgi:hypothetical protein
MPDHDIVNRETQHEKSDVNVRALAWAVVIFVIFAALTHLLLYAQFRLYARHFRNEASQPLTMMGAPSKIPATPRLQPFASDTLPPNANTPVTDMEEMRVATDKSLNTAGWVDKQKGVVRLPINVAKQLVVQRGLPVVKEGAP